MHKSWGGPCNKHVWKEADGPAWSKRHSVWKWISLRLSALRLCLAFYCFLVTWNTNVLEQIAYTPIWLNQLLLPLTLKHFILVPKNGLPLPSPFIHVTQCWIRFDWQSLGHIFISAMIETGKHSVLHSTFRKWD